MLGPSLRVQYCVTLYFYSPIVQNIPMDYENNGTPHTKYKLRKHRDFIWKIDCRPREGVVVSGGNENDKFRQQIRVSVKTEHSNVCKGEVGNKKCHKSENLSRKIPQTQICSMSGLSFRNMIWGLVKSQLLTKYDQISFWPLRKKLQYILPKWFS